MKLLVLIAGVTIFIQKTKKKNKIFSLFDAVK